MLSLIAAMDLNSLIGNQNQLPWHLPEDLKHFKKTTRDHTVVMGRKTYESIGRPLPKRTNVVLTTQSEYTAPGCEIIHSPEDVYKYTNKDNEVFIIGGTTLYEIFLPQADKLYLTKIHDTFTGDSYFPAWNKNDWELTSSREETSSEGILLTFETWSRLPASA